MSKVTKDNQIEDATIRATSENGAPRDKRGEDAETDPQVNNFVHRERADEVDEEDDLEALDDVDDDDDNDEREIIIYDANAEDAAEEAERMRSGVYAGVNWRRRRTTKSRRAACATWHR